ncbi:methyltransferase [Candidatus Nitrosoglobus terrae]|uniref:Methyltransferase n=1 Tax=Candidatus Nitrosoglobus terrae TaxID=1630141 RepID=A0A1Q2SN50_9GAMM|nr:methyltransferase domain-containing protein [Candidatus Nitrosoglobus terrae]BAW80560.1 methyltransferase [Candidatus Nitrosoglobus terrae]
MVYDIECALVGLREKFRQKTIYHAQLNLGDRVLDIGCGTGVLTQLATKAVGLTGKVIGVDPSIQMIALARKNASHCRSQAQFKLGLLKNFPLSMDILMSYYLV